MSPRARHLLWCAVFLAVSLGFVFTALALGFGIEWDLARTISNESTIFQGQRTGPAWAVIPGLFIVGVAGSAIALWVMRQPVEAPIDADELHDDWR